MKEFFYKLLLSVLAVFAPIKSLIFSIGFVAFMDLLTGIMAAKQRGEKIESAKSRRTIVKLLGYQMAIITGFVIEKYMVDNSLPITKIIAGAISTVELQSVLENLQAVTGVDFWEKFKNLLNKPKP